MWFHCSAVATRAYSSMFYPWTVGKHIIQVLVVQITNVNVVSLQGCCYKGVQFNVLSMDGMVTVGKHIIQVLVVQITNINLASQQRCCYKGVLFNVLSMDVMITVGKHISGISSPN